MVGGGGGGELYFFFGKHMRLWKKHHNLMVPKLKKYTNFWVTCSEKHPFLHHFIPGFCEKYSLFYIFVDFDTLIEWSE